MRVAATIFAPQSLGHEVERIEPAKPKREMLGQLEIADQPERHLADGERLAVMVLALLLVVQLDQFVIFSDLAAAKQGPVLILDRAFERERVKILPSSDLRPPGRGWSPPPLGMAR